MTDSVPGRSAYRLGDCWVSDRACVAVTTGGPGLVAVGWRRTGKAVQPIVWTSEDGMSWTLAPDIGMLEREFGGQVLAAVTVGGPGLVAVGSDGTDEGFKAAIWTTP